jgi:hypothetical protein
VIMEQTHRIFLIKCNCGTVIKLTEIQFHDLDCGMMGFFNCPECNNRLMPHCKDQNVIIEEMVVDGYDNGWT